MTLSTIRCFVCGARALMPTDRTLRYADASERAFALACGSCGVLVDDPADGEACRLELASRLSVGSYVCGEEQRYGLDVYTLRIAATVAGRGVVPAGDAQHRALREPHSALAAAAHLFDLTAKPSRPLALGVLCRRDDVPVLARRLTVHAGWAAEIVLLVDDAAADPTPIEVESFPKSAVRVAARPLAGDFAAQRNALAALSPHEWMLQLDADETLSAGTGARLGALIALGETSEIVSIGLARRNLVDGVPSDLYPDIQYRLNHRSVVFDGRVHERPQRDWQRSFISLHGSIDHDLTRAHVETRSLLYDAMAPGQGRMEEASLLLEPYRP